MHCSRPWRSLRVVGYLAGEQSGGALIATVRSRCRSVVVAPPSPDQAQEWLMAEASALPDQASRALTLADGRPVAAELMTTGEVAGLAGIGGI